MDDIVEDARREVEVLLSCWQTQGNSGEIFRNYLGETSTSEASSVYFDDDATSHGHADSQSAVRFVISDLSQGNAGNEGRGRILSAISPGTVRSPSSGDYFAAEEGNAGGFDLRREGVVAPGTSPLRNVIGRSYSADEAASQSQLDLAENDGGRKLSRSDDLLSVQGR